MKKIQTGVQWSRYCLRSLFVTFLLMLTFGVDEAWGDNTATITRRALDDSDWTNINNGGSSSAYITWKGNDAGQHVTFKLSGGTFKNATWQYFQSTGDQTHKIEWIVDEGYTVSVKNVSLVVRSSLNGSTVKVGQADFVTNPYGGADDFIPVSSGTYSPALGNNSYVNILFVDGYSSANNFIETLTVTYTIEGVGNEVRFSANSNNPVFATDANPYYLTQDSVQFKLDIPNYENDHFYVHNKQDDRCIKWTPKSGYTIAVTGVKFNGYNATYKGGFLNSKTYTGKSYVKSYSFANSSYNPGEFISQESSADTYSFTTSNTTVFPDGNALGNKDYFNVYSRNKDDGKEDGNKAEYSINWVELSYRVTPPAPNRKNYTEQLVRNQYVEGRANNTVTLTDYFRPFHVGDGVSMLYEVKKKVGETFEIIEAGYDITDDVFKTTNVGIYQVRAKTNATGAFTASAWSSDPIQITIEEVQPLTVAIGSQELFVDETTTMTITEQLNTTEEVEFDYDENFFDYNESTGVLTIKNDGNASFNTIEKSIHITQASDGEYAAVDIYKVFTIKKYANALSCSWGSEPWSKSLNFDEEAAITFSSNNDTGTPIVVTPSPASSVAIYDGTNNKIVANHRTGDVTWEVSQVEDYKYQAATTKTLTVNVGTVSSECYVLDDSELVEWATVGRTEEYSVDGPASKLQFEARRVKLAGVSNNEHFFAEYSTVTDGDSWTRLTPYIDLPQVGHEYWYPFEYDIPQGTKRVRMRSETGATGYRCIQNVKVTRDTYIDIENADEEAITEIDMPNKTASGDATTATFYVDYSTCDDEIKVVSDHPHITVSDASFSSTTAARKAITLTYNSSEAEEIEATVTIYTRYEHKTLTVNAETKGKLSTTIEYKGADSYAVDHANMNATDLFQVRDENGDLVASPTITLISNATGVINTVSSNTAIDFLCGGSATITASYAGDATYAAASNLGQTITVNKLSDAISWSGVGDDGKIHVWADTTITLSLAESHTPISYSSSNNTILSVAGSAFTAHKPGEVTLTATSAGDCTYASATDTKQVVVDHCRHFLVWDQDFAALPPDDEEGHIDFSEALTAYAVDSTGVATGVTVNYSMPSVDFAHIEDGVLYVTGTGSTTITATTVSDDKFAVVSKTIAVNVLAPGDLGATVGKSTLIDNFNNEAKSVSWTSGHVTFTLSGNGLYTDKWVGSKYFYLYARSSTYTYELTWTVNDKDVNGNSAYIINVKKLTLDVDRASGLGTYVTIAGNRSGNIYDSGNIPAGGLSSGDLNLGEDGKITITVETSDAFWSNIAVNNINVLYTLLPVINTENQSVDVTVCDDNKQLLDLSECASLADRSAHAALSYRVISDNASDAHITADKKFYANSVGSYTVRAAVPQTVCHNPNTAEFTITVTPAALSLSPTASDITYHQALSASTLTGTATVGGCAVAGTWAWSAPTTVPYVGEDQPFAVVFTPSSDADNYSGFTTTALVDVKRAQFIFDGSGDDEENKENWAIVDNWQSNADPGEEDVAIIRHDVIIAAEVAVYSLKIEGESKVTVAPTGGLTVGAGGIIDATKDNLKLQAGTSGVEKGQTGYLRISPYSTQPMPEATVELFSIGYTDYNLGLSNPMAWQYVGYPIAEGVKAKSIFDGWIYNWIEQDGVWKNNRKNLVLQPFAGYATTQDYEPEGLLIEFNGQLVENGAVNIPLVCSGESDMAGWNAIANSFSAPIDITKLTNADFSEGVDATVYIFNTGSTKSAEDGVDGAGQYISIPINLAGEMQDGFRLPAVIPSMQGFFVKTNQAGSLTLDYKNVVWNGNYGVHSNKPLRVKSSDERTQKNTLQVSIYSEEKNDNLYMLESEDYSSEFENGYDARKMQSGDFNIFSIAGEDKLAVDATNSIIGTRVGVRTGEETAYTLLFTHLNIETEIALLDSETGETTDINEGTEYTFFAAPETEITERFYIVERSNAPEIATDVDNVSGETKVQKFIKNGQMYILKNGVLYNATGAVVR